MKRVLVIAYLSALAFLGGGCAYTFDNAPSSPPAGLATGSVYRDPMFGWTVVRPQALQSGHDGENGMFTSDSEWFANFNVRASAARTAGDGIPDLNLLRRFPSTGAALVIWFGERMPGAPPLRDSSFPITLRSLRPASGRWHPLQRLFYGDGSLLGAMVWFGPHASSAVKHEIAATLASLRFPRLRTGTVRANRFEVLGRASSYPVGSVTHFAASSLPMPGSGGLFLKHARGALYSIPDHFELPVGAQRRCAISYDPDTRVFTCASTGMQWNLVGEPEPTSNMAGAAGMTLGLHIATVAQDGHVLYAPEFGALLPGRLKGNPWA